MPDYKILAFEYFRGEISASDEALLYAWANQDSRNLENLHAWENEWEKSESNVVSPDWNHVLGRLATREVLEDGASRIPRPRNRRWYFALSVAAMAILGVLLFVQRPTPSKQIFSMEAPAGEKCRMVLPDSTVVWLNSGSRLVFDDSFNHKERNIELYGEAYFDVARDESRPFTVRCGDALVSVKGTKFNVSAYPEDNYVKTSVIDGHVVFSQGFAHIELTKGQTARFDRSTRAFSRLREDTSDANAWTESRFVYNGINIYDLAEKLSRTYAVRFHFNTTRTLNYKFNISLRNSETLPEVVAALERIIPVKITIEGDNVYVNDK